MIDKIISFFDEDNQFKEVWELKLIKFDIDLDDDLKPYEKYVHNQIKVSRHLPYRRRHQGKSRYQGTFLRDQLEVRLARCQRS